MQDDFYKILEVEPTASLDEIKKKYRSLAMRHHPDRGGDQEFFKRINVAYDTLSDQNKRAQYDQMRAGGGGPHFHQFHGDINDIFAQFFRNGPNPFGDIFNQRPRNRDLNLNCRISLLESLRGKRVEAKFNLPSGKPQTVEVTIPGGIQNNSTIRYTGLGDDSIANAPRGNLNVTVIVEPHPVYERHGSNLYTQVEINPIEAMIGCKRELTFIDNSSLSIIINSGSETGKQIHLATKKFESGDKTLTYGVIGVIKIVVPVNISIEIKNQLKEINKTLTHFDSSIE